MGWSGPDYALDPDELQDAPTEGLARLYVHVLNCNDDRDFELKNLLFNELCARSALEKETR